MAPRKMSTDSQRGQSPSSNVLLKLGFSEALGAFLEDTKPPHILYQVETAPRPTWRRLIRQQLTRLPGQPSLKDELEELLCADEDDKYSRYYIADCLWSISADFRSRLFLNLEDATCPRSERRSS